MDTSERGAGTGRVRATRRTRHAQDSTGGSISSGVARDFSELARDLEAETDFQAVMQRTVAAAVTEIDGCTGAAITLLQNGRVSSPAHSDETARRVGEAQTETREGPCVDTSRDELTLRSDDLRADARWPAWAAAAVANGVLSVMSFQLFVEATSMGALDVYGGTADAFGLDAENIGLLLAAHAAIAMSAERKVINLQTAVDSRDVIGQAKGILMERYKIGPVEAFDLLNMASQRSNVKLRDVAGRLADSGELITGPSGPPATG